MGGAGGFGSGFIKGSTSGVCLGKLQNKILNELKLKKGCEL